MTERIYRYVVRVDSGAAPNPFGEWCSLAICKPNIRRTAQVGDWIVGQRSRLSDRVIYVMQVEECLSFAAFWNDPRFRAKRPDRCISSDNIYRKDESGALIQVPNRVHQPRDMERDLRGARALVSRRYWYFGDQSPRIPADLAHLLHEGRAYSLPANRRETDVERLVTWLSEWTCGIHGDPIDWRLLRPTSNAPKFRRSRQPSDNPQRLQTQPAKPRRSC